MPRCSNHPDNVINIITISFYFSDEAARLVRVIVGAIGAINGSLIRAVNKRRGPIGAARVRRSPSRAHSTVRITVRVAALPRSAEAGTGRTEAGARGRRGDFGGKYVPHLMNADKEERGKERKMSRIRGRAFLFILIVGITAVAN